MLPLLLMTASLRRAAGAAVVSRIIGAASARAGSPLGSDARRLLSSSSHNRFFGNNDRGHGGGNSDDHGPTRLSRIPFFRNIMLQWNLRELNKLGVVSADFVEGADWIRKEAQAAIASNDLSRLQNMEGGFAPHVFHQFKDMFFLHHELPEVMAADSPEEPQEACAEDNRDHEQVLHEGTEGIDIRGDNRDSNGESQPPPSYSAESWPGYDPNDDTLLSPLDPRVEFVDGQIYNLEGKLLPDGLKLKVSVELLLRHVHTGSSFYWRWQFTSPFLKLEKDYTMMNEDESEGFTLAHIFEPSLDEVNFSGF